MVMALEGYVYYVNSVYSYWDDATTSTGGFCDVVDFAGVNRKAGNAKKAPQSTDKKAVDKTKAAPVKPAAASSDASAQYYEGGHYDNRPVFAGDAAVINGVVTTMAGPRKEKWDSGVFEYVVAADIVGGTAVTALDPNVP
jgi:DNA replication initiation complex subunit (GINS family)